MSDGQNRSGGPGELGLILDSIKGESLIMHRGSPNENDLGLVGSLTFSNEERKKLERCLQTGTTQKTSDTMAETVKLNIIDILMDRMVAAAYAEKDEALREAQKRNKQRIGK